ncbi:metallophosphoesterase family protein [Tumebacillus permanentifrigoris]|uniref:DNA repair exonuclease SbcCD nuclease subunit n=1 Tax=Tumebacillus permanentifrigoris TaxID=378543 RepID=A0A316DDR0_9BACL|nr:DNA repair exonuclease [Tumebacillus permanentifrigoris]PWK16164.1 DNA repair exonuclease SbcCD nuclease subunit [Tumebacillus permanentifrigoris]
MRETIRLLQAGDLHIGTAFSGSGFGVEKARRRRREVLGTFRLLCEAALTHRADVLLLTGDLFEAEWVTEAEVSEVRHLLGKLQLPVLITPGNHDALLSGGPYSWGEWPDNVHLFGPAVEAKTFPELGLTVHGYGYGQKWVRDNPMAGYRVPADGLLHVVMIHGSYEAPEATPYWPVSRDELLALGADYIALGHYHQAQVLLDEAGLMQAAYAGSLEPLGYDETGEHGAFLLQLQRGGARVEWLPIAQRAYRRVEVELDGCTHLLDAADRIRAAVPEAWRGRDLLEIVLGGAVDPGLHLDAHDLTERLQGLAFHVRLTDRTHPDLDGDAYLPTSAAGRYVAKLRERLATETDEQKRRLLERALVMGLNAYERGKVVNA